MTPTPDMPTIGDAALAEIEALATAATEGPWEQSDEWADTVTAGPNGNICAMAYPFNAAYIAAMSPDVALALVARVRRLEAALRPIVKAREAATADLVRQGFAMPERTAVLTKRARAVLNGEPS